MAVVNTWGMRKTVGAVAVAAAVAGVGGAAIAAATETGYHSNSGGFGGFGGFGGPPPAARHTDSEPPSLHGEYVVSDDHGGFATHLTQTGKVTAISPTSVTARSDDGFTQTYVIHEAEGATAPPFAVGDSVVITATRQGEAATVSTMGPPLVTRSPNA